MAAAPLFTVLLVIAAAAVASAQGKTNWLRRKSRKKGRLYQYLCLKFER
jgi:hypothetical protein